jgi:hypothetical protein
MNTKIPVEIASILLPFATLFTKPVWGYAQTLLMRGILTTGKLTSCTKRINPENKNKGVRNITPNARINLRFNM